MKNFNLVFTGCKNTTLECMKAVLEMNIQIDLLITIPSEIGKKNNVAGYYDLSGFAKNNHIDIYVCDSYSLNSQTDQKNMADYSINLMLVIGWQRLIPPWLLSKINVGAFGMHGSSRALPYGRGRSPMNWSLIQNKDVFITNLFRYNAGVDAGEILDSVIFDINSFDTAQTLHYKNTLSMIKILKDNIESMLSNNITLVPQLDIKPSYYPKRTADDGIIFWDRDTIEIYNLVRAVTRPFHGAFTFYNDKKVIIWKAYLFDTRLFDPSLPPGIVLETFLNGDFIVKTGSDSLIITEYETEKSLKIEKGMKFNSAGFLYKSPYDYPAYES